MPTFDQAALEVELTRDEGVRFTVYVDTTGNPTVGIGHNLNAGPLPNQTYPMTQAQVDALFASDVASTVAKLDTYLPWWRTLDDVRQRVLINMTFNLGIGRPGAGTGLLGFSRFLGLMKTGQYAAAADDLKGTLWAKQVGHRASRLEAMLALGFLPTQNLPNPPVTPYPTKVVPPYVPPAKTPPAVNPGMPTTIGIGALILGGIAALTAGGSWHWIAVGVVAIAIGVGAFIYLRNKGKTK